MSTIEISSFRRSFEDHPNHIVVDGVELAPRWRRWGQLPETGAQVDIVPSLHADRLNVVDDSTLELVGSIPRSHCPAYVVGRTEISGVVISATISPRPVVVISLPQDDEPTAA